MDKENLLILTLISTLNKNVINIVIIDADTYYVACKLKRVQVFAISMRDLEFQAAKEVKPKIDSKSIISEEYHNFSGVFSKKYLDILPFPIKNIIIR